MTEMTKILAVIEYMDDLIVIADPRDIIIKRWAKQINLDLA